MKNLLVSEKYQYWLENAVMDSDLQAQLKVMSEAEVEDAFYQDLSFGTGGLRGIIGAGTNRMNVYTVGKATQGVAEYLCENYPSDERKVAIAYDTRIKSDLFARTAARIFAADGICVYMYEEPMPTLALSFAIRELHCAALIGVTASHNPANYNGYKVYNADGCQITNKAADAILSKINGVDMFSGVRFACEQEKAEVSEGTPMAVNPMDGECGGMIREIPKEITNGYVDAAVKASMMVPVSDAMQNLSVIYTPLHGTGRMPVAKALEMAGFSNVSIVKEQEAPDGNFPTCPKPNPEEAEAMALGLKYCMERNADLLIATDPDCDRVAIALPDGTGEYRLMNTNEVGVLLLDFICKKNANLSGKVFMKTIVTTDMAELIAKKYGLHVINTLTGFKYIGEQLGELEKENRLEDFLFSFEESCGYLSGSYVRDKDGVNAAVLICDMAAYYKGIGTTPLNRLEEMYREYGYCLNVQRSFVFEGKAGKEKMAEIMDKYRGSRKMLGGIAVEATKDYLHGIDGLPASNVLKFFLPGGSTVTMRPSGTEPKLKVYFSIMADNPQKANEKVAAIEDELKADIL